MLWIIVILFLSGCVDKIDNEINNTEKEINTSEKEINTSEIYTIDVNKNTLTPKSNENKIEPNKIIHENYNSKTDNIKITKNETTPKPTNTPKSNINKIKKSTPIKTPTPTKKPTPTICIENWKCQDWKDCINGKETRICEDDNNCKSQKNETRDCEDIEDTEINHLIFTEILYDTLGKESEQEFVEIYNPTNEQISLTGWSIEDNSGSWDFPDEYISSNSYFRIAKNSSSFEELFSCKSDIDGFSRGLNNDGDQLILKNNGQEIDFVAWETGSDGNYMQWILETEQEGETISRDIIIDTDQPSDWNVGQPSACDN